MLNKKTVFVIGAGSGFDIKMPMGAGLADAISETTEIKFNHGRGEAKDPKYAEMIRRLAQDTAGNQWPEETSKIFRASKSISAGVNLSNSIDDFVNIHQSDHRIVKSAKIAIALNILKAERQCLLYNERNGAPYVDFKKAKDTWYRKMFIMLTHSVQKNNINRAFQNVSFINFNYDRCLEFYLKHALMGVFTCEENVADEIVRNINILHPYGQVGFLPGIREAGPTLSFGGNNNDSYDALRISDEIITYTETISDNGLQARIQLAIEEAQQIIFLGFGFHAQNMNILTPESGQIRYFKNIYATGIGLSVPNSGVIEGYLRSISNPSEFFNSVSPHIHLDRELDCSRILSDYDLLIRS